MKLLRYPRYLIEWPYSGRAAELTTFFDENIENTGPINSKISKINSKIAKKPRVFQLIANLKIIVMDYIIIFMTISIVSLNKSQNICLSMTTNCNLMSVNYHSRNNRPLIEV